MILLGYALMCLIFGTTFLAIKVGIDAGMLPFFSAGIRFVAAGGILLLYMVWRGKARFSILWHKESLLTGFMLTFGTFSTLYWSEQYVDSGLAAVLSATGPLTILILQAFLLRQKPALHAVTGCAVGFMGVVLLMLPGFTVDVSLWWVMGCLLILAGELCYSSGALYSKKAMGRFPDTSPIALNAAQMLYGGVMLLVLSAFTERPDFSMLHSFRGAGSLVYLTVAGSMVGHTMFYWLVSKTNPVFPATWLYVSPLIALGLGIAIYDESFSWVTVAGAAVVLAGIILVNGGALKEMIQTARRPKAAAASPLPANGRKSAAS